MPATAMDIHARQAGDGYTVARHALSEIDTAPGHRVTAAQLGEIVGNVSGQEAGTWLRNMRTQGWVKPLDRYGEEIAGPIPMGTRALWTITDAGAAELEDYRVDGLLDTLVNIEGREDLARQRHGDERVDRWFRECMDTDPDEARREVPHAWQDTTPVCTACSRTLVAHNGHWTCTARGCSRYGDSQGDGATGGEA